MSKSKAKITLLDKKCTTPKFQVSFPHVFKPHAMRKNQEAKFQITMLFDKDADLSAMKRAVHKARVEAWGPDKNEWPKHRSPFRNGDKKKGDLAGYKGKIYVNARAKAASPPQIIDRRKNEITEESGEFYAGCFAHATLIAFKYGNPKEGIKDGIAFSLQNIQKLKDGPKFSGKKDAGDEFDEIEEEDDEESEDSEEKEEDW